MPARSSPSSPAVPAGSNKSLKTESTNDGTSGPYSSYWRVPPGMQSPTGMMPAMASWPVMARHSIPPFRVPPHLKGIIKSFDGADSRPPLAPASPSDTGHHPDDRRLQGVASTSTRACRDCPKSQKGDVATAIQKNCLSHTGNSNQRPLRWPKENTEGEPSIDEPFESYPQAFQAAYYGCEV